MSAFEEVLEDIGTFGPHQIRVFLLVSAFETPAAWAMLLPVFAAAKPSWRCPLVDPASNISADGATLASNFTENTCGPQGEICNGLQYTSDFTSIVSEWNLICGNDFVSSLVTTIQMVGVLVGACATGQLADIYGRRKLLFIVYALLLLAGFTSSFANSWQLYAACRFLIGAFFGGTMVVNFVLPLEFVGRRWRTFCGCIGFWACGVMTQALMAYYLRQWRHLAMASSLGGILLLFTWWFIPESPRWLVQKGRMAEAEVIIQDMARTNGKAVPNLDRLRLEAMHQKQRIAENRKYTYLDLCRTLPMTRNCVIMMFAWFVSSCVYYGTSLNVGNLSGNRYINFFLSGLVEIPALFFVVLINNRWGRRRTLTFLMLVGGASCFAVLFVVLSKPDMIILTTALAMLGRSGMTGGWAATQVYSAEVFPTVIRNIGIATCSMSARIGGIVAPQIVFLNEIAMPLPYVIFGGLGMLCGLLALALPETLNQPLPDTLPPRQICNCLSKRQDNSMDFVTSQNGAAKEVRTNGGVNTCADHNYDSVQLLDITASAAETKELEV